MSEAILCATGVYTYLTVARTFFCSVSCPLVSVGQSSSAFSFSLYTSHALTHTHGSSQHIVARCAFSLHLASPFVSSFPPCLLFPDGNIETTFPTVTATAASSTSPTTTLLPLHLTNLRSARYAHSAKSDMASGYLAESPLTTVQPDHAVVSDDEDDQTLVRPATRREPSEKRRDQTTGDGNLAPLVPPRPSPVLNTTKEKGTASMARPHRHTGTTGVRGLARANGGCLDFC